MYMFIQGRPHHILEVIHIRSPDPNLDRIHLGRGICTVRVVLFCKCFDRQVTLVCAVIAGLLDIQFMSVSRLHHC